MDVIGEASDGRSAMEMAEDLQPDVVVMDIGMPGLNGIEAMRKIISREPQAIATAIRSVVADKAYVSPNLADGFANLAHDEGEPCPSRPPSRVSRRANARCFSSWRRDARPKRSRWI